MRGIYDNRQRLLQNDLKVGPIAGLQHVSRDSSGGQSERGSDNNVNNTISRNSSTIDKPLLYTFNVPLSLIINYQCSAISNHAFEISQLLTEKHPPKSSLETPGVADTFSWQ